MRSICNLRRAAMALALSVTASGAVADVLDVQPVAEGVWTLVGPSVQRDAENLGNNGTFGLVVTNAGAIRRIPLATLLSGSMRGM